MTCGDFINEYFDFSIITCQNLIFMTHVLYELELSAVKQCIRHFDCE